MILLKKYFSTSQGRISPTKLSQSNRIILEITKIDEVGDEVTKVVQEQEKDVTLLDFEEDKENVQNDENINENGVEKKKHEEEADIYKQLETKYQKIKMLTWTGTY
ncbi:hypothetical protein JTB14_015828 [Gonioctena quinquepunctata]|nr:hypothetical protein JTB14_015828 [Gonioctena quinquepunctata]